MEDQHVILCSDVAAFVDALETFSSFPTQSDNELKVSEKTAVENSLISKSEAVKGESKRFRINPKEQKEIIEDLFEKQKAVVTERSFMNLEGTKRFKSDVWNSFGDIKLLISSSEAKKLKIPFYIRYCGGEQMILSKTFVACFKCTALFIHDSQRSGTSTLRSHIKVCSRPRFNKKRRSPTIIFFPNKSSEDLRKVSVSKFEKHNSKNRILNFFLSSQSNFDTVENIELKKLLQLCISIGSTYGDVNINSMLCPPEKLSEYLLNNMYVTGISKFYTEFQHTYGASYFLNVWLDENKHSYISSICYYSTPSGDLKSVILHTTEFPYKTKLPNDAKDWFVSFLLSQPVVPTKRLIVTDFQSNLIMAFNNESCVTCATDILNSILNRVFSNIKNTEVVEKEYLELINGCITLVAFLEQNSFVVKLLRLQNDLIYCWKNVVNLLKSINHNYESIYNFLNERGMISLLFFENFVIYEIINFFHLFEIALQELSVTTEPTMNIYIPWIIKLRKHTIQRDSDSCIIQYFKSELHLELNEKISNNVSVYHRIATLLDPRFKNLIFLPREDQIKAGIKLKELVKECIEALLIEDFSEAHSRSEKKVKFPLSTDDLSTERNSNKEVDQYFSEPFQLVNQELGHKKAQFNPLKFWTKNCNKYPHLNKIALWILSCPISCFKTEESFLDQNWFVNSCRIRSEPEHVNKMLFVRTFNKLF